MDRITAIIIW